MSREADLLLQLSAFGLSETKKEQMLKEYAKEANAPKSDNMLPNWIFKVGVDRQGVINYEVNGAFMYLNKSQMDLYRQTIMEAIYEAEEFYRSDKPKPPQQIDNQNKEA